MTTDDVVVDVSQDWVLACDVQQRFMQSLGRTSDSVDYSARCRQVRALGGDCYDFMSLTNDRLALVVGDASGKGVAAALMIASVQSCFVARGPLCDRVLWRLRRSDAHATVRECRTHSADRSSAKRFNRYARDGRRTCWYGEEWGVQRLLKATAAWARLGTENAEHLVRSIFNSMDDFSRGCQTDDATLAVLRVL